MSDLLSRLSDPVQWIVGITLLVVGFLAPKFFAFLRRSTTKGVSTFIEKLARRDVEAIEVFEALDGTQKLLICQAIQARMIKNCFFGILYGFSAFFLLLVSAIWPKYQILALIGFLLPVLWMFEELIRFMRLDLRLNALVAPSARTMLK